jgi:hypothetical protein
MQTLTITIKRDGKVTIDVSGVTGSGCKALTQALENSLGKVTSDTEKGEFYEPEVSQAENQF